MNANQASEGASLERRGTVYHVTCCDYAEPPRESWTADNLDAWVHPAASLVASRSDKDITWAMKLGASIDSVQATLVVATRRGEDPLDLGFACEVLTLSGLDPVHVSDIAAITRSPAYGHDICRAISWVRRGIRPETVKTADWFHLDLDFIEKWVTTFGTTEDLDLLLAAIPWDRPVDREAYGADIARYLEHGQVPDRLALRTLAALLPQRP